MRQPYVEDGPLVERYLRSAQIDREEADCLDPGSRRDEVLASAAEFEALARDAREGGTDRGADEDRPRK